MKPSEVKADEYAAIFYAGGHGTMWDFAGNIELQKIAAQIYEADGIVGAVCHGPSGLINIKLKNGSYLVAGKKSKCFYQRRGKYRGADQSRSFLTGK